MSREEAHKLIDRILDMGYRGAIIFDLSGTGLIKAKLNQEVSSESNIVAVAI